MALLVNSMKSGRVITSTIDSQADSIFWVKFLSTNTGVSAIRKSNAPGYFAFSAVK